MNADNEPDFNPRSSAFIGGLNSFTRSYGRGSVILVLSRARQQAVF